MGHQSAARSCAEHTCAILHFQDCGRCLAALEMCNNLGKTHPRIFLPSSHFFGLWRFKHFEVVEKVHVLSRTRTMVLSTCIKLLANPVFTNCFVFFLSPFLYSTVHDSLLCYTAIFQLSTAREGGECVGTNMKQAERHEAGRKKPNGIFRVTGWPH